MNPKGSPWHWIDLVRNLEAAARLGIRPVLVLSKEQKGVSSFTEIVKLAELMEIVKE